MKNADYWRGRFSALEEAAYEDAEKSAAAIENFYREAQLSVQQEIESWYQRFALGNGITLSEARRWLAAGQLQEFQWSVEQYIKVGQQGSLSREWVKKLENASARFHVSRLEALQVGIQQQMELLYGNQVDELDGLLRRVAGNGYTHTAYEIQKGLGIGWDITGFRQDRLEVLLKRPWTTDGKTFRDRCWANVQQDLAGKLHKDMMQCLLRGDSPEKLIRSVQKDFEVSRYKARRLVHTETSYFSARSNQEAYRELCVDQVEILETLDSRTCEICGGLDGRIVLLSEYEPGVTVPPFHPNCRGTTVPYYDDKAGERAARNADVEVYYVPAETTYASWKAAFVDGGEKHGLAKHIELPSEMVQTAGMAEDIKAEVKRAIEQVQSEYDVKIDEIVFRDISSQGKVPLQFNPVNDGGKFKSQFIINSGYDWNESLDALNDRIYNKNYKVGTLSSQNLTDLIYHEMAHFMTFQDCETWADFLRKERFVRGKFIPGISRYNTLADDGAETIAEGFVARKNGASMPDDITELVQTYVERWKK